MDKNKPQPKAFRITEETSEKFKEIAQTLGANQQQTMAKLIEVYEAEIGRESMPEMRENIDMFEGYMRVATSMYMQALETNQNMRTLVRTEYEAQLKSKDKVIEDLQKKMQAAHPRFQATKAAYDKRDLLEFLIASGAEPKAANDIAGRIRDQKQEAVFWKAMESRMRSFNVQDIAIQEQIDGTDGKTAAVSWSFKNAGTGADPDASRETLYFIRQDNGLWYWVSFADYTAFRKENGTIQDSGPELNAEAEDPFGLFSGRDHQ